MNKQITAPDLKQLARRTMQNYGFVPDFSAQCQLQLTQIAAKDGSATPHAGLQDLRGLLWSSIDNLESKDLDQIEYAERLPGGDIRLLVGIADVDSLVPRDTPIDKHAYANCFSIYTGIITFPMLPPQLSEDRTSLLQDGDRNAIVTEIVVGADGTTKSSNVYAALVRNKAKLAYEPVAAWLDGKAPLPQLSTTAGLEEQLRLQDELAGRLVALHHQRGELNLQTIEPKPIMQGNTVLGLEVQEQNRAREVIKNIMVSANIALAEFLRSKKLPVIERVVEEPERWSRIIDLAAQYNYKLPAEPNAVALNGFIAERREKDPDHFSDLSLTIIKLLGPGRYVVQMPDQQSVGHFGLAVHEYTHSTAPNRRYPDLITQRIVKAALSGQTCPYSGDELKEFCQHAVDREDSERKLERFMRKAAAATLLLKHIGDVYDAIVTGVSPKGTYVRLTSPPAEGRVMRNEAGLKVGDRCKVKLISANPQAGFIDFAAI